MFRTIVKEAGKEKAEEQVEMSSMIMNICLVLTDRFIFVVSILNQYQ